MYFRAQSGALCASQKTRCSTFTLPGRGMDYLATDDAGGFHRILRYVLAVLRHTAVRCGLASDATRYARGRRVTGAARHL